MLPSRPWGKKPPVLLREPAVTMRMIWAGVREKVRPWMSVGMRLMKLSGTAILQAEGTSVTRRGASSQSSEARAWAGKMAPTKLETKLYKAEAFAQYCTEQYCANGPP